MQQRRSDSARQRRIALDKSDHQLINQSLTDFLCENSWGYYYAKRATAQRNQVKRVLRMYLWWSSCTLYLLARQTRVTIYKRLRSLLLCLCDVFRALINSLVCWFCTSALGLVLLQIVIINSSFFLFFSLILSLFFLFFLLLFLQCPSSG